jgi:2-hydroxychromene-2-carboxylate isomerase
VCICVQACSDIGIRGFPTWVINGKNYEGEQSLENLEADLAIRS